ncbi:uncharacterized protein TNCV_4120101 [Trichonephila clavipes]|nr:uncharacterized protein TNCV_4120101 [Trichonephila clavipes]
MNCQTKLRINHLTAVKSVTILEILLESVPANIKARIWFQHDGAPAHFSADVRSAVNTAYPGRWIGRDGPVNWLARLPDLSCLDFFLWGHMKSLVYASPVVSDETLLGGLLEWQALLRGKRHSEDGKWICVVPKIVCVAADIQQNPDFIGALSKYRALKTQKSFNKCVREYAQYWYNAVNDNAYGLLSHINPLELVDYGVTLDWTLNVRKNDRRPAVLRAITLETTNTHYPHYEKLHIYTEGSRSHATYFNGEVEVNHLALLQLSVHLSPPEKAVILSDLSSAL